MQGWKAKVGPYQEDVLLDFVSPAHMEGYDGLGGFRKLFQALVYDILYPRLEGPGLHMNKKSVSAGTCPAFQLRLT